MDSGSDQEKIDLVTNAGRCHDTSARPLLFKLLGDESEDVRYYAIRALVLDTIDRGPEAEHWCWRLFNHDQSSRVRGLAAVCIGSLYSGSRNKEAFAKLKLRVANAADRFESESALEALYNIVSRPPDEWPTQRRILAGEFETGPPAIPVLVEEARHLEAQFLLPSGGK